jgi:hypothetical protein
VVPKLAVTLIVVYGAAAIHAEHPLFQAVTSARRGASTSGVCTHTRQSPTDGSLQRRRPVLDLKRKNEHSRQISSVCLLCG